MADAISEKVLKNILQAYAAADSIPNSQVIRELSAAAGSSEQALKNAYTEAYRGAGNEDDPWDGMPMA